MLFPAFSSSNHSIISDVVGKASRLLNVQIDKESTMSTQNFGNHVRYHALYHFVTSPLTLVGLIWSLVRLFNADSDGIQRALIDLLLFIIVFLLAVLVRTYALKVQDRAIRAEESLRFFILTGKPLDSRLRLGQIVALRFASDEELPELANLAVEKSMSVKEIKGAIRQWRADDRRV
jgi:hypothetical protein